MEEKYPKKILFLSDTHIGGIMSNFSAYQSHIVELMTRYDHVVMIGDIWELFRIDPFHIQALSGLLGELTEKDPAHWRQQFNDSGSAKSGIENVIYGAERFTTEFLEKFPHIKLHYVGGNHENIRRFRNRFAELQRHHPNFEWSTQAIRIGDALVTHGHLPLAGKTDEQYPVMRLRTAEHKQSWQKWVDFFSPAEHKLQKVRRTKERASAIIAAQMQEWSKKGDFEVSHNGIHEPLRMDWVKHLFFGHTHIKFDNYRRDENGMLFHNTGAIVKLTSENAEDTGLLEARLNRDGTVTDVAPVKIAKDIDAESRPRPKEQLASR